jgi:Tol biopolymer transport system component
MGEVFRARDPRLGRDVAIKALSSVARADADRLARFQREAHILAALNHPHIAAIYGLEELGGAQFLVLELVEGGTLADRLRAGPLSLQEALPIARQVADALHAAHEKGIIHRDLKPANIALTQDGQVKVLDFGVAKTFASTDDAATVEQGRTEAGTVIGTAAYMSPEQTRGLSIDKRTDVWAFGCVLHEMLSGRPPFRGGTTSDTIVAVLNQDPDWTELAPHAPPRIQWLVRRCLQKDSKRRLHDIADARIELDDALAGEPAGLAERSGERAATGRVGRRERLAWIAATTVLAVLVGALALRRLPPADAPDVRVYQSSILLSDQLRVTGQDPGGRFALSPDGRHLALVASDASGQSMLWLRPLDGLVAQPLAGTEGASVPFWSPDSRSIAFVVRPSELAGGSHSVLKKVDITGGHALTLAEVSFGAPGAWSPDGVILFTPSGNAPLHRISSSGGTSSAVTALDTAKGEVQHSYPSFLPDGRHFLFSTLGSTSAGATAPGGVYVGDLEAAGAPRLLVEGASHARYANGYLVYLEGATLFAQSFDPERLELAGEPVHVVDQVQRAALSGIGLSGAFTISNTGTLAYQASTLLRSRLAWFDRTGRQIREVGDPDDYEDLALSPDGTHAAVSVLDPSRVTRDLWIYDVDRGFRERFTSEPSDELAPVWSTDGKRLIFSALRGGSIRLFQKPAGGSDAERTLPADDLGLGRFAASWSRDGRFVLYVAGGRVIGRSDLWVLPLDGTDKPHAFVDSQFVETQGQFSPDGRWVAFMSNTSGVPEIYVTPFPNPGDKIRVSTASGGWPRWRQDGREIFYLEGGRRMMAAALDGSGSGFRVGKVEPLFPVRTRPMTRLDAFPYDVTADGQRFLINTFVDDARPGAITLVVNWPEALKK